MSDKIKAELNKIADVFKMNKDLVDIQQLKNVLNANGTAQFIQLKITSKPKYSKPDLIN